MQIRADRKIVLAAVLQYRHALRYVSEQLRSDPEFILTAVQLTELALQHASEELRADREIVLATSSMMDIHFGMPRRSSAPTARSF